LLLTKNKEKPLQSGIAAPNHVTVDPEIFGNNYKIVFWGRVARWFHFQTKTTIFGTFLKAIEWKFLISFVTIWFTF
jgi:hypothetical protein